METNIQGEKVMAIFKPEVKENSGGSKFLGICELQLENIEDKSEHYDWADIYLDVTVKQRGSEYTRNMRLVGSLEKDATGNITGGSVLNRLYKFFDIIGCKAGLTIKGEWETEEGHMIENIGKYLTEEFINPLRDFDYLGYIYKEQPKKSGDKAWTKVYPKLAPNTEDGRKKLEDDIKWLKSKGYLKEFNGEQTPNSEDNSNTSVMSSL